MAFCFSQHSITHKSKRGFTLIELLIVVSIMGLLTAAIAYSVTEMIRRGKVARAQGDGSTLAKAILQLSLDTAAYPKGFLVSDCYKTGVPNNHIELDESGLVGLMANDGTFTNWKGPYIEHIPIDPWGNKYILDQDYECNISNKGCAEYEEFADASGEINAIAIYSRGENKSAINVYDDDNIVTIICAE